MLDPQRHQLIGGHNARLVAVVDEAAERAQAFSERYGVPWYTDLSAMLARADVQVVTVAAPSGLRGDVTVRAARAGKHVIVEKPIEEVVQKGVRTPRRILGSRPCTARVLPVSFLNRLLKCHCPRPMR
ncbi:MAG: Gfo/Idh/MocA family protein [Bacilli bacterium]